MIEFFAGTIRRLFCRPERALFAGLIVCYLIPIWAHKYFPSQDGPTHLENAFIVMEYFKNEQHVFFQYYVINMVPGIASVTLWAACLLLSAGMYVMPYLIVEKLFLSVYIVLLPLSIRYVIGAVRKDSRSLAVFSFPFIYNFTFNMGFYSFLWSLPVVFFTIGYWLKSYEKANLRSAVCLNILVVLSYLFIVFSAVVTLLTIMLLLAWILTNDIISGIRAQNISAKEMVTRACRKVFFSVLGISSGMAASVLYILTIKNKGTPFEAHEIEKTFASLSSFLWEPLVSYGKWNTIEVNLSIVFMLFLAGMSVVFGFLRFRGKGGGTGDAFLFVAIVFALIWLVVPSSIFNGGYITSRVSLFAMLMLVVWLGSWPYGKKTRAVIQAVGVTMAVLFAGAFFLKYGELNDYLDEYMSGKALIEPGKTLLPVCFSREGQAPDGRFLSSRVSPFVMASSHIAIERSVINLANYEACKLGQLPIHFRPVSDPTETLPNVNHPRQGLDLAAYSRQSGKDIDYLLVWGGGRREDAGDKGVQAFFRQIEGKYELIYVSSKRGLMKLYKLKSEI